MVVLCVEHAVAPVRKVCDLRPTFRRNGVMFNLLFGSATNVVTRARFDSCHLVCLPRHHLLNFFISAATGSETCCNLSTSATKPSITLTEVFRSTMYHRTG